MKKFVKISLIVLFFAACTPQTYYQLVETDSEDLKSSIDYLIYENDDVRISYDFWANRGNGTFIITNLNEKDLFIDLKRSHLIINGMTNTYFQNRNYTTPKVPIFTSSTHHEIKEQRKIKFPGVTPKKIPDNSADVITFNEERIICIPANSSQVVYGFELQSELYRDCNLLRFPKTKEITSSEFNKESSPLKYRNFITYGFSESMEDIIQIENEFWVSKITNLPENEFKGSDYLKFCNDSSANRITTYPYKKGNLYFYKYKLEPGRISH